MTADAPADSPSVLVVDDEPDMRDLARLVLEMDGLVVHEAADGSEALDRYFELNPPPTPSAVVLDNRMPGMNGLEVAERMLSHNPDQVILLFSAHLDRAAEAAARDVGVRMCVSKVDARHLPRLIRELLAA